MQIDDIKELFLMGVAAFIIRIIIGKDLFGLIISKKKDSTDELESHISKLKILQLEVELLKLKKEMKENEKYNNNKPVV